jgi:hypothetical protein
MLHVQLQCLITYRRQTKILIGLWISHVRHIVALRFRKNVTWINVAYTSVFYSENRAHAICVRIDGGVLGFDTVKSCMWNTALCYSDFTEISFEVRP